MTSEQRDPFEDRAVGPASPSIATVDVIAPLAPEGRTCRLGRDRTLSESGRRLRHRCDRPGD
jgi:hypothetical protein